MSYPAIKARVSVSRGTEFGRGDRGAGGAREEEVGGDARVRGAGGCTGRVLERDPVGLVLK